VVVLHKAEIEADASHHNNIAIAQIHLNGIIFDYD